VGSKTLGDLLHREGRAHAEASVQLVTHLEMTE
jgi:hypothetical protein